MKKQLCLLVFISVLYVPCHAQDFGLSFSYFLPRNGYFSTPISPFSIRGLGFNLGRYFAVQTGGSLYRMSGMNLKDLPFESREALTGPNFTVLIPLELVVQFQGPRIGFDIKGGGFFFYGFAQKLNYGNLDRAIRRWQDWQVANSEFSFGNHPGFGYQGGAELSVQVTSQVGVSIEANYYVGDARFPLSGSFTGGNSTFETTHVEFEKAKIDFTGLEFAIGLMFSTGTPGRPARHRRR